MKIFEFKQWLITNKTYTKRVVSNIISRLKRANKMLPVRAEEIYIFELEHIEEFQNLTVTVRSQLRKAVKLYIEFEKNQGTMEVK